MKRASRKRIKILVVDDHLIVREGLRTCLRSVPNFDIVGEAPNGEDAARKAKTLAPNVVLMDISMPKMNGLETTREILRRDPGIGVLVLTVHNKKEYVLQIIRSGARGYLLKDTSPAELVTAIQTISEGGFHFSSKVSETTMVALAAQTDSQTLLATLTPREKDVFVLVADGCSNKEVSERLGVGVRTVETHRSRVMHKLNTQSVASLTKLAIQWGLLRVER